MISDLHSGLLALQDEKYRDFSLKLLNTSYPVIGIRMPVLRAFAKELLKQETPPEFKDVYYEEVLSLIHI